MRTHSRVGSMGHSWRGVTRCPATMNGVWRTPPQGLNPRQALTLNDLMNHGISRALLQLFPPAKCTHPLVPTSRNTAQEVSLLYHPSGEPGTPRPVQEIRRRALVLQAKQHTHCSVQTLLLLSLCGDTASAGPPLRGVGDLRGSETAPGLWGSWDPLGPPQSPPHPGAAWPAHTRLVHSLPTGGSRRRPRLCPQCQRAEGWPWDNRGR